MWIFTGIQGGGNFQCSKVTTLKPLTEKDKWSTCKSKSGNFQVGVGDSLVNLVGERKNTQIQGGKDIKI